MADPDRQEPVPIDGLQAARSAACRPCRSSRRRSASAARWSPEGPFGRLACRSHYRSGDNRRPMSEARQQSFIDAPVEVVWELLEDVDRHPEWWPRVLEVECEEAFEPGCTYREVVQGPTGDDEMLLRVDRMEDCKELTDPLRRTRAPSSTCSSPRPRTAPSSTPGSAWSPPSSKYRVFDMVAGKRYFRSWLEQSLEAMQRVAASASAGVRALAETALRTRPAGGAARRWPMRPDERSGRSGLQGARRASGVRGQDSSSHGGMGDPGLEPGTSSLSERRSDRLS